MGILHDRLIFDLGKKEILGKNIMKLVKLPNLAKF